MGSGVIWLKSLCNAGRAGMKQQPSHSGRFVRPVEGQLNQLYVPQAFWRGTCFESWARNVPSDKGQQSSWPKRSHAMASPDGSSLPLAEEFHEGAGQV